MNIKKLLIGTVASAALLGSFVLPSFAANVSPTTMSTAPGQDKLQCFDGPSDGTTYGGKCNLKANGAKGPATLDNSDNNANGDYAGVYYQATNLSGQQLSNIKQLSYTYSSSSTPTPGSLSLNIPVDTNGDHITDTYAFVDAYYCPGTNGRVDVVNDTNCGIWVNGNQYTNWAALVAAEPSWTIGVGALPFVIAERTPSQPSASWTVSNVTLGKPGQQP